MSRICMIVQSLYPQDERVRREAEALARQSVEVDVICMKQPSQPVREQFGSITVYRIMNEAPKESLGRYLWLSFRFALRAMLRLQSLARERSYEVIQVHNMPDFLVFAGLFQKL